MHKNKLKAFLETIGVFLPKERLHKTASIGNKGILKIYKNGHEEKALVVTLGQKLKMHKNMLKTFLQHIAVVLCKKRLQKTANIRKMRAF